MPSDTTTQSCYQLDLLFNDLWHYHIVLSLAGLGRKRIQHRGIFQPNVHCPQNRWGVEAHNQPEVPQYLLDIPSLPNGRHRQPERCTAGRQLYGKDRCLSLSADSPGTLEVFWNFVGDKFRSLHLGLVTAPKVLPKFCSPFQGWWERQPCISLSAGW